MDGQKEPSFLLPSIEAGKKYGFVKGVALQAITREEKDFVNANPGVIVFHGFGQLRTHPKESLDVLFVGEGFSETSSAEIWSRLCEVLVPNGQLRVKFPLGVVSQEDASARLLLGGLINSRISQTLVAIAEKPSWKPSAALPLKKKAKGNVWKLAETSEIVDEDALLQENDCGGTLSPTGVDSLPVVKKKACKNCTCGLADAEKVVSDIPQVTDEELEKSLAGCGNCAKGDAFRCGGCPYLGTPAFTPGTKPQVVVKSDGSKSLMLDVTSNDF
jgi:hypothetical protein